MEIVLQKISKSILYLLGWEHFDEIRAHEYKKKGKNYVLTFSHTSVWDGVIFILYKFAHPDIFRNSKIPVKPQIYDSLPRWAHSFLDHLGFIKSTAYEKKNGGFVGSTIELLKNKKDFLFIISPKGKREKSPWRSGYYTIGQTLNCDYIACGLDYEKKKILMFEPISGKDKTKEEVDTILQKQLEQIIPLNIEYSEVCLRKHKKQNITIVGISFGIILLIIFMTYVSWYYKLLFIGILILFFILL
jgi:hypothetical protein